MTQPSELSRRTGRGGLVNLAFGIGTDLLAVIQGIVVPRLLGPENMGLFELAMGGVMVGMVLKSVDLPRKVVQERDTDLHTAYAVAFTLELVLAGGFFLFVLGVAPLLAYLYDRPELWLLTTVLAATIFSTAFLELPAAIPYREMRFVRRNVLTAIGPVVTFAVTVPAAFFGAGVWSLVFGTMAGFVASGIVLFVASPVKPSVTWDGSVAKRFLSFGWPGWLAGLAGLVGGWGAVFAISAAIGISGLAFFELAQSWAARALQIDGVLSDSVYPALCSMQSSVTRLRRAFVTISRLSMLWAAPVGLGMLVFAEPGIRILLGPKWEPAVLLLQAESAAVVANSIGSSFHLFFAARGQTKPNLVMGLMGLLWTGVVVVPLLLLFGIRGAAMSIVVLAVGAYALRQYYARRMFGPIALLPIVWRELLVGAVPALVLAAGHFAGWRPREFAGLVGQGLVYVAVAAVAAFVISGDLIRTAVDTLRRPRVDADDAAPVVERVRYTATPRPMAFPLLATADDHNGQVWVTTRDWPALGRVDVSSGEWRWFELPPFPHAPTPDGRGGCWAALTRSSAIAHVSANGETTIVPVPKTRELLVTALDEGHLWAADGRRHVVHRVDVASFGVEEVALPDGFLRPDFVAIDARHRVWVADTNAPLVALLDSAGVTDVLRVPHPTRALLADAGGGMWLGASDRPVLTHLDAAGEPDRSVDLPGAPFGIGGSGDGLVAVAVKDADAVVVIDTASGSVSTVPLPAGSMPMGCALADGRCFVTLAASSQIGEFDLSVAAPVDDMFGPSR